MTFNFVVYLLRLVVAFPPLNFLLHGVLSSVIGSILSPLMAVSPVNLTERPLIVYVEDNFYDAMAAALKSYPGPNVIYKRLSGQYLLWALKREGRSLKADVILGLGSDKRHMPAIQKVALPLQEALFRTLKLPFSWLDKTFLPISYTYYAFIVRHDTSNGMAPLAYRTLQEFLQQQLDKSLVVADPRTSTLGKDLLTWLAGQSNALLHQKIKTYPAGWAGCFAFMNQNRCHGMLGYSTSILYYHNKNMRDFRWVSFSDDPHPIALLGVVVIRKKSPHPKVQTYLKFLLSPALQGQLMSHNFTYPVIDIPISPEAEACRPARGILLEEDNNKNRQLLRTWIQAAYQ